MISDVVDNIKASKRLDESFQSASSNEEGFQSEELDDFQDAHDYFDQDMLDQFVKLKTLRGVEPN